MPRSPAGPCQIRRPFLSARQLMKMLLNVTEKRAASRKVPIWSSTHADTMQSWANQRCLPHGPTFIPIFQFLYTCVWWEGERSHHKPLLLPWHKFWPLLWAAEASNLTERGCCSPMPPCPGRGEEVPVGAPTHSQPHGWKQPHQHPHKHIALTDSTGCPTLFFLSKRLWLKSTGRKYVCVNIFTERHTQYGSFQ